MVLATCTMAFGTLTTPEQGRARRRSAWKTAEMVQMMAHKCSEAEPPALHKADDSCSWRSSEEQKSHPTERRLWWQLTELYAKK